MISLGGCIQEWIRSHLQALRKVLAEFLDWRMSEEKQHVDYLVRGLLLFQQPNGSLGRFPPQNMWDRPCDASRSPGKPRIRLEPLARIWAGLVSAASVCGCFKSLSFHGARSSPKGTFINVELTPTHTHTSQGF